MLICRCHGSFLHFVQVVTRRVEEKRGLFSSCWRGKDTEVSIISTSLLLYFKPMAQASQLGGGGLAEVVVAIITIKGKAEERLRCDGVVLD